MHRLWPAKTSSLCSPPRRIRTGSSGRTERQEVNLLPAFKMVRRFITLNTSSPSGSDSVPSRTGYSGNLWSKPVTIGRVEADYHRPKLDYITTRPIPPDPGKLRSPGQKNEQRFQPLKRPGYWLVFSRQFVRR